MRSPIQLSVWVASGLLAALGLLAVARANPMLLPVHAGCLACGALLAAIAARGGCKPRPAMFLFTLPLVFLGLAMGFIAPEGLRSINVIITPALLTIAGITLLARRNTPARQWGFGVFAALVAATLVAQNNPSAALICIITTFLVLLTAGASRSWLAIGMILCVAGFALYAMQDPITLHRLAHLFAAPADDVRASPLPQLAIADGGWWGSGERDSILLKWADREALDEFMLAYVIEQWGLAAAIIVIIAFGIILGIAIASARSRRTLGARLSAAGSAGLLGGPLSLHVLANFHIAPIRGPALPLISHDVPMLLVSVFAIGLLAHSGGRHDRIGE